MTELEIELRDLDRPSRIREVIAALDEESLKAMMKLWTATAAAHRAAGHLAVASVWEELVAIGVEDGARRQLDANNEVDALEKMLAAE